MLQAPFRVLTGSATQLYVHETYMYWHAGVFAQQAPLCLWTLCAQTCWVMMTHKHCTHLYNLMDVACTPVYLRLCI